MSPGYDVHLGRKRPYLLDIPAVRSLVVLKYHLPDSLLLILIYRIGNKSRPLLIIGEGCLDLLLHLGYGRLPCLLVIIEGCLLHLLGRHYLLYFLKELIGYGAGNILMLFPALLCGYLLEKLYDLKIDVMRHVDGLQHLIIRDLIGARLYHDDLLSHGCHGKLKVSLIPVLL